MYLSQNGGSDGHFEVQNGSEPQLVQKLWHKTQKRRLLLDGDRRISLYCSIFDYDCLCGIFLHLHWKIWQSYFGKKLFVQKNCLSKKLHKRQQKLQAIPSDLSIEPTHKVQNNLIFPFNYKIKFIYSYLFQHFVHLMLFMCIMHLTLTRMGRWTILRT